MSGATQAPAALFDFREIGNASCQLSGIIVNVSEQGTDSGGNVVVHFAFTVLPGTTVNRLDGVYFDDRCLNGAALMSFDQIIEGPGVDFGNPATPANPPNANLLCPPFVTTNEFSADTTGGTANAVQPGESVTLVFTLNGGKSFQYLIDCIGERDESANPCVPGLRIGLSVHASGCGSGALNNTDPLAIGPDCNSNGIADECDTCTSCASASDAAGRPCSIYGSGIGMSDDCDGNGTPDECGASGGDCNSNGTPDTCEVPPGVVLSVWVGGTGLYSVPSNWCPPAVPNNGGGLTYRVFVLDSAADIHVDISPTIDDLFLTTGVMTVDPMQSLTVLNALEVSGELSTQLLGGTTPPILRTSSGSSVETNTLVIDGNGSVQAEGDSATNVGGDTDINSGGSYGSGGGLANGLGTTTATFVTGNLTISTGGGSGGRFELVEEMSAVVLGNLVVDGAVATCDPLRGGTTPPILRISGLSLPRGSTTAQLMIGGTLSLVGATEIEVAMGSAVALGGNFDHRSSTPECFHWDQGKLILDGTMTQIFELPGEDRGPSSNGFQNNFAIGEIEVLPGRIVEFADHTDNVPAGSPGDCEVLYVHVLVLGAGSTVRLTGCDVYPEEIINHGANIEDTTGGGLVTIGHLDNKPGFCPNPLARGSSGVLPVALTGSSVIDVTDVVISTIRLSRSDGVGGTVAPVEDPMGPHTTIADLATPFGAAPCSCHALGGDGIDDLSINFRVSDVVAALDLAMLPALTEVEFEISAMKSDGTSVGGLDCVILVPRGQLNLMVATDIPDGYTTILQPDNTVDTGGFGSFERSYPEGAQVTLVAPASAGSQYFARWLINGTPQPQGQRSITITMTDHVEARATYQSAPRRGVSQAIQAE